VCGFFFGVLGLIAAAGLPVAQVAKEAEKRTTQPEAAKTCPDCMEMVRQDARVCRYCGHRFTAEEERAAHVAALESDDPQARREAVEALSHDGDRETEACLIKALGDPDTGVRLAAIESLHSVGDKNAAPHIMKVLEQACEDFPSSEQCWALENAACEALRTLGTEALVPRLVALAEAGGPSTNRKLRAVEALAAIGGPAAIRTLVEVLEDEHVAKQAAAGLERLGEVAIPHLEEAKETGSRTVRKAATKLLESIRDKQPE
jgi:HEAT repeat protein